MIIMTANKIYHFILFPIMRGVYRLHGQRVQVLYLQCTAQDTRKKKENSQNQIRFFFISSSESHRIFTEHLESWKIKKISLHWTATSKISGKNSAGCFPITQATQMSILTPKIL